MKTKLETLGSLYCFGRVFENSIIKVNRDLFCIKHVSTYKVDAYHTGYIFTCVDVKMKMKYNVSLSDDTFCIVVMQ
jgi:hypothetical protein